MKKTAKPHTTRKPKKGKGLKGVAKVAAAKKGMGEVAKPFGIILGLAASSLAGHGIDKIKFLAPDTEAPADKFQIKSLVKPALLLLAGAGTVIGTHGKKTPTMEFVNGLGWGFITGGTFNVVKVVLKKDPFGGLGETEETDSDYYKEQMNEMAKVLEQNKFKVELPKLTSGEPEAMKGITSLEREAEMKDTAMII